MTDDFEVLDGFDIVTAYAAMNAQWKVDLEEGRYLTVVITDEMRAARRRVREIDLEALAVQAEKDECKPREQITFIVQGIHAYPLDTQRV